MDKLQFLGGKSVFFKRDRKKDILTINKRRNNPELIRYLGGPYRYINSQVEFDWYENYINNRKDCVRCVIVDEEDYLYGLVNLTQIDSLNQSAVFSIMIGDLDNCSKGIGTFAIQEMLAHGFENLNLNRIELTVLDNNKRAIAAYEKCGFVCEGKLRQYTYKRGEHKDMYIYSILRDEYIKTKKN